MSRWNFRRSWWTGKLVLQRFTIWHDDGREYGEWRDADTSDLRDYFDDLGRQLPDNAELSTPKGVTQTPGYRAD